MAPDADRPQPALARVIAAAPYALVLVLATLLVTALADRSAALQLALAAALTIAVLVAIQWGERRRSRSLEVALERRTGELQTEQDRYQHLGENSTDLIVVVDRGGAIRWLSPGAERQLSAAARPGAMLGDVVAPDDVETLEGEIGLLLAAPKHRGRLEFSVRDASDGWLRVEAMTSNMLAIPAISGIVFTAHDITERHRLEEQLRHHALHDPTTGLANRALLDDRIGQAVSRAVRSSDTVALLAVEVRDLSDIHESLGHTVADQLLDTVAQRLLGCLRDGDTAARLSRAEFAVLLEADISAETAEAVARRLLAALDRPFGVGGRQLSVRAVAGLVVTGERIRPDDLIRRATVALHQVAAGSSERIAVFSTAMDVAARRRHELHQELREALELGQFSLHYQPIFRVDTMTVTGFEALIRWQHPILGAVPPSDFVPAAEETGLIIPISRWVFAEACRQAARWQQQTPGGRLTMSVNVSAVHLAEAGFVDDVLEALRAADLDPTILILELTESAVMRDLPASISRLLAVKELGVRIALDDFGTGYSSFGSLRQIPADILKIDRSFIDGITMSPAQSEIVRTIQALGSTLKLETVAEGVEDAAQLREIARLEVDTVQGYLLGRPSDAETVGSHLGSWLGAPDTHEA